MKGTPTSLQTTTSAGKRGGKKNLNAGVGVGHCERNTPEKRGAEQKITDLGLSENY